MSRPICYCYRDGAHDALAELEKEIGAGRSEFIARFRKKFFRGTRAQYCNDNCGKVRCGLREIEGEDIPHGLDCECGKCDEARVRELAGIGGE